MGANRVVRGAVAPVRNMRFDRPAVDIPDQGEADALLLLAFDAVRKFESIKDAIESPRGCFALAA
jgi:hypothetical protein